MPKKTPAVPKHPCAHHCERCEHPSKVDPFKLFIALALFPIAFEGWMQLVGFLAYIFAVTN